VTKADILKLFKFLHAIYPNFEVTQEKIDAWSLVMKDMDFDRVMARAKEHSQENKFPPTISEIAAYAPPENETLKQMEQWRKEAEQVPTEVKLRFKRKMQQLIREKSK